MRKVLFSTLAAAALMSVLSCGPGEDGTGDGGSTSCDVEDGGALNCNRLCTKYCAKLSECGVQGSGSSCVDDCRTLLEAGASVESYACVIQKTCKDISNCGI